MTTATLTTPPRPAPTLTLADRCDSCGAQAFVHATMPSGFTLLFCAHHGRKHLDALVEQGADIFQKPVSVRVNDTDH